jgi:exosortase
MHKQFVSKQNIKAIILVGSRDFGRCPIASRLPTALWPVAGKSVLEGLLVHLANQNISQAIICSNGDSSLFEKSIHTNRFLKVKFLNEQLPVGTAGCIRDAIVDEQDTLLLVFPASIINPPQIDMLVQAHRDGGTNLTVVFNPNIENGNSFSEAPGIYICETSILEDIPREGYFDIKEGLIPEMLRAGKTVHRVVLPHHVGNFRNRKEYLYAVTNYLENTPKMIDGLKPCKGADSQVLWIAANTRIDPSARIYGPVVIMDSASVSKGSVILGPSILGCNVSIGMDSIVVNSVLWDDAQVGPSCEIQRCIIDYNAIVRGNTVVEEKVIPFKQEGILKSVVSDALKVARNNASRLQHTLQLQFDKLDGRLPNWLRSHKVNIVPWFVTVVVLIAFLWSYWPTISDLWNIWQQSDEYSSGLLVPFLVVYILWLRRHNITQCHIKPSLWGLFAFVAVQAIRLSGLFFMYGSAERLSIALSVAALVLLLFGWQLFRKVSTVLLFLCLMLPWPNRIQAAVAMPLQNWATSSAVFGLEMIGYDVVREGNVIHIGHASVAVAEACNGLRMITAFFVISSLVVLLVKREWWEKLLILASGLPIALLCNTLRLTITAIAFTVLSGEYWEKIFHDFGGYAMMPLALGIIVLELWLLTKITTAPVEEQVILADGQHS